MEIGKEEGKPDFGFDDQQEDKIPALPPIPITYSTEGEWRAERRRGEDVSPSSPGVCSWS